MNRPRILLLTRSPEVSSLRKAVLESAGCDVLMPTAECEMLDLINSEHFDCLIICNMVVPDAAVQLVELFKGTNPLSHVVYIKELPYSQPLKAADICVCGLDGPNALIVAATKAVSPDPE